jgi:hypothetical protein
VIRRASVRILLTDLDAMRFDNVSLLMFEPLLVQVVDVISMANGSMPTSGSMSMCHRSAPFVSPAATTLPARRKRRTSGCP